VKDKHVTKVFHGPQTEVAGFVSAVATFSVS